MDSPVGSRWHCWPCCTASSSITAFGIPLTCSPAVSIHRPQSHHRSSCTSASTGSSSRWQCTSPCVCSLDCFTAQCFPCSRPSDSARRSHQPALVDRFALPHPDFINPLLDKQINWLWFAISQVAFGVVAGLVVIAKTKCGPREPASRDARRYRSARPDARARRQGAQAMTALSSSWSFCWLQCLS